MPRSEATPRIPPERFARLSLARRIWAIGAVRGDRDRLEALHARLDRLIWRGDRLVYLGNLIGVGADIIGTVDEALLFRRAIIARPSFEPDDVVFLRGAQEEMLHRAQRLHFGPGPSVAVDALRWMAAHGVAPTLEAYGTSVHEGLRVAGQGPVERARWTTALAASIRSRPGHDGLLSNLKRAAFSTPSDLAGEAAGILFVAAGVNPARPFVAQGDAFWWNDEGFETASGAADGWGGFARIVRGFGRAPSGPVEQGFGITLDGGSGLGGKLVAACFLPDGELVDLVEA